MYLHKDSFTTIPEIRKGFIFSNDSLAMYPLLNEIVSFLKVHLPSDHYAFKISNCKQILIELLTNAVKHSNADSTLIQVNINGGSIEITKTDKGRKFYLNNYTSWPPLSWPLEKKYIGERIKIYEDDISHLYATIQSEHRIIFDIEEYPINKVSSSSNLLEHYGLLIMAKFSNEFFYLYNPENNTNQFTTIIHV
ncbi:MAG: ATP-binding protein [Pyrinomonadaceae bacterium]|nr:ATP-binding protein [Sphingobacteriaceae bacterium]